MPERNLLTHSPEETQSLAADLAARLTPGTVIALHGDLGAGKTCFAQGLARGLGVERDVNSPTYTLVSEYPGRLRLNHIDLYRIRGTQDSYSLGIEDYLESDGVTVIEWAERIQSILPRHTLHIHLQPGASPTERRITMEGPRLP